MERIGLALVDHRDLHLVLDRVNDLPLAVVNDAYGIDVGFRFPCFPGLEVDMLMILQGSPSISMYLPSLSSLTSC